MVRAMVIDDSRAMRLILGRMLKEIGFEVSEASHGKEALSKLAEGQPPEIALVDWNMPEMNGIEFVVAVRADPRFAGMRLMMVTTEAEIEHMTMALEAGADEYVMKPFTKDVIVGKLALLGLASE